MKGGIFMNETINRENIENEAALILAMCYGIKTEIAVKIAHSGGKRDRIRIIVQREINNFFDSGKYDMIREIFIDFAENDMDVNALSEKYKLTKKTVRKYLKYCETYYMEYRGFIELGMLKYDAHPKLFPFLARYGRFFVKIEKRDRDNYEFYQSYKKGKITRKELCYTTHMTLRTLAQL